MAKYLKVRPKMVVSYYETITRLENILRELECEFLYLINDMQSDNAGAAFGADMPVQRLELARHCLNAAARALSPDETAALV